MLTQRLNLLSGTTNLKLYILVCSSSCLGKGAASFEEVGTIPYFPYVPFTLRVEEPIDVAEYQNTAVVFGISLTQ